MRDGKHNAQMLEARKKFVKRMAIIRKSEPSARGCIHHPLVQSQGCIVSQLSSGDSPTQQHGGILHYCMIAVVRIRFHYLGDYYLYFHHYNYPVSSPRRRGPGVAVPLWVEVVWEICKVVGRGLLVDLLDRRR